MKDKKIVGITWIDPVHGGMGELCGTIEEIVTAIEENKICACEVRIYTKPGE